MFGIIDQIKQFKGKSFFTFKKRLEQPLLNKNEILDLSIKVKNNTTSHQYKREIAFRQSGDFRSIFHGHGMDYEESRHYQTGDDPRHMNWQLSARTNQLYMKVFRAERQPGVFILIDRRASMRFGTEKRLKITQAVRIAATIAFLAQENNYSVGGVVLDQSLEWFKETKNKQVIFNFVQSFSRSASPAYEMNVQQQPTLNNILLMLNEILTTGTRVFLISDFFDVKENSQPMLLKLSTSHQAYAIQVTDPAEIKLPNAGVINIKPVISNQHYLINSNSISTQKEYELMAKKYYSKKKKIFHETAISYKQVLTTEDAVEKLFVL